MPLEVKIFYHRYNCKEKSKKVMGAKIAINTYAGISIFKAFFERLTYYSSQILVEFIKC